MKYYVSANVERTGDGTKERPFATIQEAARVAQPGDEVIVAPGVYREAVDPQCAGTEEARIVYRSEVKGQAVITGAEPVTAWEQVEGSVWRCTVPNSLFGDYFQNFLGSGFLRLYMVYGAGRGAWRDDYLCQFP